MRRKNAPFARVPCLFLAVCLLLSLLPGTALAGGDTTSFYHITSGGTNHGHMYNQPWPGPEDSCTEYHDPTITYSTEGRFTLNGFHGELEVEFCDRPITIELVGDNNVLTVFNPPQHAAPSITFVGKGSVTIESTYEVEYTLIIGGDGTSPKVTVSQYGMATDGYGSIDLRSGELHLKNYLSTSTQYGLGCYGLTNPQITLASGAVLIAEGGKCAAYVSLIGTEGPRSGLDNHNVTVTGRNGEKLYWSSQNALELSSAMLYNADGTPAQYARFEYTETPWETTEYVNLSLTAKGYEKPIVFEVPKGEPWQIPENYEGHAIGQCIIGSVNTLRPGVAYACLNDTAGTLNWANGVYHTFTFYTDVSSWAPVTVDGEDVRSVQKEGFENSFDRLPVAVRPGYRFGGWFTQRDGEGEPAEAGKEYEGNQSFYAFWKPNGVHFVDGDTYMDLNDQQKLSELPEGPETVGGIFQGWYTQYGGRGEQVTLDTVFPEGEITDVFAYYEYNRVTFLNRNPSTGVYISQTPIALNDDGTLSAPIPADPPAPEGYRFDGWYLRTGEKVTQEMTFPTGRETAVFARWTELDPVTPPEGFSAVDKTPLELVAAALPAKRAYRYGEALDTTGLVLWATLGDGSRSVVTDYTVSGYNANQPGTQTITLRSGDLATTYTVTVSEPSPAGGIAKPVISTRGVTDGREVALSCASQGDIYYTLDGSTPTSGSTLYTGPFTLTGERTTVKAVACAGGSTSGVTAGVVSLPKVSAPEISSGGSTGKVSPLSPITITTATPGATVYYTTDGTDPSVFTGTSTQRRYNSTAVTLQSDENTTVTLRAAAVKDGCRTSDVTSAEFEVGSLPTDKSVVVACGYREAEVGKPFTVPVYLYTREPLSQCTITINFSADLFAGDPSVIPVMRAAKTACKTERSRVTLFCSGSSIKDGLLCYLQFTGLESKVNYATIIDAITHQCSFTTASGTELDLSSVDSISGTISLLPPALPQSEASLLLTGADGQPAASLAEQKELTFSVSAGGGSAGESSVFAVLYNPGGQMIGTETWSVDLSDTDLLFTQTVHLPEDRRVGSVKVLLPSGQMTPLIPAVQAGG